MRFLPGASSVPERCGGESAPNQSQGRRRRSQPYRCQPHLPHGPVSRSGDTTVYVCFSALFKCVYMCVFLLCSCCRWYRGVVAVLSLLLAVGGRYFSVERAFSLSLYFVLLRRLLVHSLSDGTLC